MQGTEIITHYFPHLTEQQKRQFGSLGPLYKDWNEKINVISRKDIDNLYVNHVLHSLGIAKVISFLPGAESGIAVANLHPRPRHGVDASGEAAETAAW